MVNSRRQKIINGCVGAIAIFCFVFIAISVMDFINSIQSYLSKILLLGLFSFSLPIFSGSFVDELKENTFKYLLLWGIISLSISEAMYLLDIPDQIFVFWIFVVVISVGSVYRK